MARLVTFVRLGHFLVAFTATLSLAFLFYESADGCSVDSIASFDFWRRGMSPVIVLMIVSSGYLFYASPRTPLFQFLHITCLLLVLLWLAALSIFHAISAANANIPPSDGGRFDNPANDDRYCCVYKHLGTEDDCPPANRACLDIDKLCKVGVSEVMLQWGPKFTWDFFWSFAYIVIAAVMMPLALVVRCAAIDGGTSTDGKSSSIKGKVRVRYGRA